MIMGMMLVVIWVLALTTFSTSVSNEQLLMAKMNNPICDQRAQSLSCLTITFFSRKPLTCPLNLKMSLLIRGACFWVSTSSVHSRKNKENFYFGRVLVSVLYLKHSK